MEEVLIFLAALITKFPLVRPDVKTRCHSTRCYWISSSGYNIFLSFIVNCTSTTLAFFILGIHSMYISNRTVNNEIVEINSISIRDTENFTFIFYRDK